MKVIIAGSREITDFDLVSAHIETAIDAGFDITEVVSGTCRGVDRLGEQWAENNNIPIIRFPANWDKYAKGAGPIRNEEMAQYADGLIALFIRESKGTKDMVKRALSHNLKIYAFAVD